MATFWEKNHSIVLVISSNQYIYNQYTENNDTENTGKLFGLNEKYFEYNDSIRKNKNKVEGNPLEPICCMFILFFFLYRKNTHFNHLL